GRPRGVRDPWPSGTRPLAGPRPPHRLALCLQSGLTAAHAQEMNTAIVNFGEAHNTLIQNKEDYMTSQMTSWHASFFNKHRERQYNRNRQRIMDIKKARLYIFLCESTPRRLCISCLCSIPTL
ncbi:unnamed protein product, partial [Prorocentrum cordatum]